MRELMLSLLATLSSTALCLASPAPSAPCAPAPGSGAPESQENVLVIVVDDLGLDKAKPYGFVDANGDPIAPSTPNIDRIARQGMMFRNAWAAPSCSPSRATSLTSKYPHRHGMGVVLTQSGVISSVGMSSDETTIADLLPSNYLSAVIGKWHLAGIAPIGTPTGGIDHAPRCGFDLHAGTSYGIGGTTNTFFDWFMTVSLLSDLAGSQVQFQDNQYETTRTTDVALRSIRSMGDRPFFMWVAYHAPHQPYHVPPAHLIQSPGLDLTTNQGQGEAMIEALDTEIGRLLQSMDPDVLARTTVIWLADNGTDQVLVEPPFDPNKAKRTIYNGGVQVPFYVMSRRIPPEHRGSVCDRIIDVSDLLPTITEMVGGTTPTGLDGTSFLPYLSDPQAPAQREWIFAERFKPNFSPSSGVSFAQHEQNLRVHDQTARNERFKLLRFRRWSVTGQLTSEHYEFYDMSVDYLETNDLLDSQGSPPAAFQSDYDELKQVLLQLAS